MNLKGFGKNHQKSRKLPQFGSFVTDLFTLNKMESQKRFKIFGENGNHILYGDNEQNWLQTRSFKGIKKTQTISGA